MATPEPNLFAGIEAAEAAFFTDHLTPLFEECKAARRALLLLLYLREPLGQSEETGESFDVLEQSYIELAAGVFANGRAAFLLIAQGYLFPAKILLRSIWEQVVFMEYFRLYPETGRAWASAEYGQRAARTPEPMQALNAINAKGDATVLGGKRGRLYEYLTPYAHAHRAALSEFTTTPNEQMFATVFGPAHEPKDLDLVLQLLVSLLVSAVEVLRKQFQERMREVQADNWDSVIRDLLSRAKLL